ncbi:MAG TPA: mechanosensitive ion channel family protein [Stellaceae bacterium]|nr:mechanosensitive ion channel family protein [Stellaceae bacterium]
MSGKRAAGGYAVRAAALFLTAAILATAAWPAAFAQAQGNAATAQSVTAGEPAPPQIKELLRLLSDPKVRDWIERGGGAATPHGPISQAPANPLSRRLQAHVAEVREHIFALGSAVPNLPAEFTRTAGVVTVDLGRYGRLKALLLVTVFAALGFGLEWLFRRATGRLRLRLDGLPVATVTDRLRIVAARFAFGIAVVAVFALGSIGAFVALNWPPLLGEMVLDYLIVFLAIRIALVVGRFLLSPDHDRFRIIPMSAAAARFWRRRIAAFVGLFVFGWVEAGLLASLGVSPPARQLVEYGLGLGLMAIALEAVWRRPIAPEAAVEPAAPRLAGNAGKALLSLGIVLSWMLWVLHAMPALWLVLVIVSLPLAIGAMRRATQHILRPPGTPEGAAGPPGVAEICLERGIRAVLFIAAAAVLAWGWGIDLVHLAAGDDVLTRSLHGVLSAVIIVLVADVFWYAAKAGIDRKHAEAVDPGHPNTEEARRRARLRTLLPIFRNILFVVVITVAGLMALAAIGVQIGPLIAGAGVVGVAVGFGAQSFVRDVIAGMFYLLDDAFRVGEYIQAGNYKGTVEGFSIRSVRLRHHRGPVYTVPFSLLGAVQNQSRDWVIDKMTIGVTYDSNLDLARKLIKQVGQELAEDPEFAPLIIEPLKMQGVEQFGDFAVQIRIKMMTLPGEQFVIRRKAYAMIKKAFDANGIKFAFPTVQIAGDGDAPSSAVGYQVLGATQPAAE